MKKVVLIAAALFCTFMYADAQYRPGKFDFSTEMYYSPGGATNGQFSIPDYGAKVRMFINEKFAVSLNLGVSTASKNDITYYTDANNADQSRRTVTSDFNFSIMPGFEYHFTKFERVSPYVGAAIGFICGSTRTKSDNSENDNYNLSTRPTFGMGIMATSGVDVYICKGLFAGLELGLGYQHTSTGRSKDTSKVDSTITETKGTAVTRNNTFGFFATPSLRIGWLF